ncbi:HAD hydrolase family protein [candidate division KSB1 bacterium]|nr:HAD hydrolase family protein [candidate division KSB1 bacterium]
MARKQDKTFTEAFHFFNSPGAYKKRDQEMLPDQPGSNGQYQPHVMAIFSDIDNTLNDCRLPESERLGSVGPVIPSIHTLCNRLSAPFGLASARTWAECKHYLDTIADVSHSLFDIRGCIIAQNGGVVAIPRLAWTEALTRDHAVVETTHEYIVIKLTTLSNHDIHKELLEPLKSQFSPTPPNADFTTSLVLGETDRERQAHIDQLQIMAEHQTRQDAINCTKRYGAAWFRGTLPFIGALKELAKKSDLFEIKESGQEPDQLEIIGKNVDKSHALLYLRQLLQPAYQARMTMWYFGDAPNDSGAFHECDYSLLVGDYDSKARQNIACPSRTWISHHPFHHAIIDATDNICKHTMNIFQKDPKKLELRIDQTRL